jgi:Cu+-exporting ATPase
VTFAAQYQLEFFWVGIAFNAAGIAFIGNRLWKATKDHAQCAHA